MERLLSPEEAGEYLGLTADAVRRLAKAGHITHVKLGDKASSRTRFRVRDLEAYVNTRVVEATDRTNSKLVSIRQRRQSRAS